MNRELKKFAEISRILSNEVRLCILINLCKNGEIKVGDLQKCAGASQSLVSQQLGKLRDLKVITSRKEGLEVFYKLEDKRICEIIAKLDLIGIVCEIEGE